MQFDKSLSREEVAKNLTNIDLIDIYLFIKAKRENVQILSLKQTIRN